MKIINKITKNTKNGLNCKILKSLVSHRKFKIEKTQYDFYKKNNASQEILKYTNLQGRTFGEKYMESIACEYFNLDKRSSSTHDHIKCNKKIEQKSARYHANGNSWKWQHIELDHDWDYLLLTGLDFNEIVFYIGTKRIVKLLIQKKIITGQGKKDKSGISKPQQAYWFSKCVFKKNNLDFNKYFTKVLNEKELIDYIKKK